MKKQLSLALALWMLLMCLVSPAFAEGEGVSDAVVFTNGTAGTAGTAGVVVTKKVVNYNESYPAPEYAEFIFALNVGIGIGRNQPYEFYNNTGKRVVQYIDWADMTTKTTTEDVFKTLTSVTEVPFTTNESGNFKLKAGETAKFTGLDEGTHYQIMEVGMPEGFTQIEPADPEGYSGTASADGGKLTFTNRYHYKDTPPSPPGGPDVPDEITQSIRITKNLISVPGYTQPATEKEFTFRVNINGEPWEGKKYLVMDAKTNKYVSDGETSKTPEDQEEPSTEGGLLTLRGGQYALLEDIPRYSGYVVEEVPDTGETENPAERWWPVGEYSFNGVITTEDLLLDFNNANASFGVKKTVVKKEKDPNEETEEEEEEDTVADTVFTFQLLEQVKGEDNTLTYAAWADAPYYLYNAEGKLADEALHKTDSFGGFQLMDGQTAIFVGAEPGKVFAVKENTVKGFAQVTPGDPSGYQDQKVSASTADVLPFVNTPQEINAELTVTKSVKTESAGFDPATEFVFQIQKKGITGSLTPVSKVVYTLNGNTLRTAEDGTFTLKSDETAYFSRLAADTTYEVTELGVKNGDAINAEELKDYHTEPDRTQSGVLKEEGLDLTFVNYYNSAAKLKIIKVDDEDNTAVLPGAEFKLQKLLDDNSPDPTFKELTLTTNENGEVTVPEIVSGRYSLLETKAPEGYLAPEEPFLFEVSIRKGTVTVLDNPDNPKLSNWITGSVDLNERVVTVTVENGFYVLPKTGGLGTHTYALSGLLLLSAAFVFMFVNKKSITRKEANNEKRA